MQSGYQVHSLIWRKGGFGDKANIVSFFVDREMYTNMKISQIRHKSETHIHIEYVYLLYRIISSLRLAIP